MYEGIEAYGGINSNGFLSVMYCCAVVILGNFVLLNVFLAIAVNSISDAKMMKTERHSVSCQTVYGISFLSTLS